MRDVIVIGAGVAGMTTAIYVQRAGRDVLVLEQDRIGGQVVDTPDIENYPGIRHVAGADFAAEIHEQALEVGAQFAHDTALRVTPVEDGWRVVGRDASYEARCVVIATGTRNRRLGLPGEEDLEGRGVAYTTARDEDLFCGLDAVVCGGGNSALEEAEVLARRCAHVTLVYRGDAFHADVRDVERLRAHGNVDFVMSSEVVGLVGEDALEGVRVRDRGTGEEQDICAQGLLVAIGRDPDTARFADLVQLDDRGYVVTDENGFPGVPGVFAAGDCRSKPVRQVATAVADGVIAALTATRGL